MVEHKIGNVIAPLLGPVDSISGGSTVGGWKPDVLSIDDDDEITETDSLGGKKVIKPPSGTRNLHGRQLYIECCVIRRGETNPLMLPLQLLVFCLPSHVHAIGAYLTRSTVVLEHPLSYDPKLHLGCRYNNPHSSQPREALEHIRQRLLGGPAYAASILAGGAHQVKAYDAHEQVDAVFKSLASGVDLDETEPSDLIKTPLYAHQKQALSFMLDRETLKTVTGETAKMIHDPAERKALVAHDEDNLVSLWKKSRDTYGRHVGWVNVVTGIEQIGVQPPNQCRGSLLADDMGLGKTISIISLIANTLEDAQRFSQASVKPDREATKSRPIRQIKSSKSSSPEQSILPTLQKSTKQPKESKTAIKKQDALLDRQRLIKIKSRATLIVCPLSTVQNWESQIEEHVRKRDLSPASADSDDPESSGPSGLRVCVYHGNNRTSDTEILANYDVVITTYSLLGYEYSRQNRVVKEDEEDSSDGVEELDNFGQPLPSTRGASGSNHTGESKRGRSAKRKRKGDGLPSPLQAIEWFRVVLDEAQ